MTREKNLEKQMGCMAGFLNIFDRHHILAGKRIYSAKTLPPSSASHETDSSPEPEKIDASPQESTPATSTPDRVTQPPTPEAKPLAKTPVPLSVFEFKEGTRSPWKFAREAPRLSLDSRAVIDAKGTLHPREIRTNTAPLPPADADNQRKSTSVIARLMGLDEPSPDSDPEPEQKLELRRSVSESRVHRDRNPNHQYRFFDTNGFQLKQLSSRDNGGGFGAIDDRLLSSNGRHSDPKPKCFPVRNVNTEPARGNFRNRGTVQKKSFYDSADFFPEAKQSVSIDGEIERRLKMRGIDEPSKDLDKLKQILEALQLKGLLHSKNYAPPTNRRNFDIDGIISGNDSPIVVMKPRRLPGSFQRTGRLGSDSPPLSSFGSSPRARRNGDTIPSMSLRCEKPEADHRRNARAASQVRARISTSPTRGESGVRSPSRIRKVNDAVDTVNRRISPVHSAKGKSRMNSPEQHVTSRSPRMRRGSFLKEEKVTIGVAEDEASIVSESSFSTSSHTDTERLKMDEYREGRNLLERCDKLLNSIAEITAAGQAELQPSPVSVLDWPFYKEEESCSPSPVMKRCIDYKELAVDSEDDMWSGALCYSEAKSDESTEDSDFVYVSEILRACNYLPEDSDIFLLLEKQQYLKGNDTSKVSTLRRRLIFDTVHEILHRNLRLPPWKEATWAENTSQLHRIWSEFRRIREREEEEVSEEMFEVICGVLKKDVAEDGAKEWGEFPVEMGELVLDMERLVFKDLIGETIRELASCKGQQCYRSVSAFRRKLLF